MTDIQKRLLQMLKWFHRYCNENNLTYYIVEGTVIGALRHQGFIPWDDDIDVAMPRGDYDRLIQLFNKEIGNYVLETPYSDNPSFICPWCKLFDTTTTKIEESKYRARFGIYIDIFPLDGLGENIEEGIRNFKRIDRLNMLWATRVCSIRKGRGIIKNAAIMISGVIPQIIINDKKLIRRIDSVCKNIDYESSNIIACTLSTYRFKEIMGKKIYGKPTRYKFEDTIVYGPELADEYLTTIYGNWRQLPPIEKQVTQHDYIYLNLEESYLNNFGKETGKNI